MSLNFNAEKEVTNRLLIEPVKDENGNILYGGNNPVKLLEIKLDEVTPEKGEFEGITLVGLRYEFQNVTLVDTDADRFATVIKRIVGSQKRLDSSREDSKLVDRELKDIERDSSEVLKWVKHIWDNLSNSPNFKPMSDMPAKDLKLFNDIPIEPSVPAADRAAYWNKMFTAIYNFMGGGKDGQPMWLDVNGNPIGLWAQFSPAYPNYNYYTPSTFVGKGLFEPLKIVNGKFVLPRRLPERDLSSLKLRKGKGGTPSGMPGGIGAGAEEYDVNALIAAAQQ